MLPVSGAAQLKTRDAIALRPMISASGAYSRLVSPAPCSSSGRNRFQSPIFRAFFFSSSRISGEWCGLPEASTCSCATRSAG